MGKKQYESSSDEQYSNESSNNESSSNSDNEKQKKSVKNVKKITQNKFNNDVKLEELDGGDYLLAKYGNKLSIIIMQENNFINVSKLCYDFDKDLDDWKNSDGKKVIKSFMNYSAIEDEDDLFIEIKKAEKSIKGIYMNPKLIHSLTLWISSSTHFMINDIISQLLIDSTIKNSENKKNTNSVLLMRNNVDDTDEDAENVWEYTFICTIEKNSKQRTKKHLEKYPDAIVLMKLEKCTDGGHFIRELKQLTAKGKKKNRKLDLKSKNFNLVNDTSEKEMMEIVKNLYREKFRFQ